MAKLNIASGRPLDVFEILNLLYDERRLMDDAIASLQRLESATVSRRRGRPPKWLKDALEKRQPQTPK